MVYVTSKVTILQAMQTARGIVWEGKRPVTNSVQTQRSHWLAYKNYRTFPHSQDAQNVFPGQLYILGLNLFLPTFHDLEILEKKSRMCGKPC